ncbi:hypothetical protein [Actinomycetospora atypica]|uniref:MFS transporter n=1 Tax=Actinomycetospora atypica TaxID=1290095 RepID=A0ABV9YSR2_9PSEU
MTSARAVAVGALAPALGAALHVEAGGGAPEITPGVLATGVLVAASAGWLSRRRPGAVRLAAILAAGQLAWHVAMGAGHAGMDHGPTGPSPAMVAAHVVTTLLVALGVTRADRAVLALVADRIVGLLTVPAGPRPSSGTPLVPARTARKPTATVLLPTRPLRGPPVRPLTRATTVDRPRKRP